jgi:hypothetical protein
MALPEAAAVAMPSKNDTRSLLPEYFVVLPFRVEVDRHPYTLAHDVLKEGTELP